MAEETFGWAVVNGRGSIILPVFSTRTSAIGEIVTSFDSTLTRSVGGRLAEDQWLAWRRLKYMGLRCVRVRVEQAFGGADAP